MDPRDLGVTPNAYFSLSKHTIELSLLTYCDTPVGNEVSFRTHREMDGWTDGRTDGRTDAGRTDRRGSRNSYLDL